MIEKTQHDDVVWGVDFGGSAVRMVRVSRADRGYHVDRIGRVPLDERWETAPDVAAAAAGLGVGAVDGPLVAGVSNELVLYRTLSLPEAEPDAMGKMVRGQMEALIPMQEERFVSPWRSDADPYKSGFQRVLVCVARRDALAPLERACGMLGGELRAVVPSALAVATVWSLVADRTDRPTLLLDVGARCTTLAVTQDGKVLQCGVIDQGGDRWTEQLAAQLDIPCPQVEQRKLSCADAAAAAADPTVCGGIQRALGQWARLLGQAWRDCAESIPAERRPKRCILFGRSSRTPALAEVVASTLDMDVQRVTPNTRLTLAEGIELDDAAAAIGAALCAMEADAPVVDLLSGPPKAPRADRKALWRWAALVGWLLAALVTLYGLDRSEAGKVAGALDDMRAKTDRNGGLDRQLAIGTYLESAAPPPLALLERIGQAMPEKGILTTWTYDRGGTVLVGGTVANAAEFGTVLQKLGELGHVTMKKAGAEKKKFAFDLELRVQRLGPAPPPATQPASKPATQPATQSATQPTSPGSETKPAETRPGGES